MNTAAYKTTERQNGFMMEKLGRIEAHTYAIANMLRHYGNMIIAKDAVENTVAAAVLIALDMSAPSERSHRYRGVDLL